MKTFAPSSPKPLPQRLGQQLVRAHVVDRPHDTVLVVTVQRRRGEVQRDVRRERPVEQTRRQLVVLREREPVPRRVVRDVALPRVLSEAADQGRLQRPWVAADRWRLVSSPSLASARPRYAKFDRCRPRLSCQESSNSRSCSSAQLSRRISRTSLLFPLARLRDPPPRRARPPPLRTGQQAGRGARGLITRRFGRIARQR